MVANSIALYLLDLTIILDKKSIIYLINIGYMLLLTFLYKDISLSLFDWIFHTGMLSLVITDILDYAVFLVIPFGLLFLYYCMTIVIMQSLLLAISTLFTQVITLSVLTLLSIIIRKAMQKDLFGFGDVVVYISLIGYVSGSMLFYSFILACFYGSIYGVCHIVYSMYKKKTYTSHVPFIPFIYLGIITQKIDCIAMIITTYFQIPLL